MSSLLRNRCAVLEKRLDGIADVTGRTVAWLTLAMMAITCLVVVLRYALNVGSIGLQESVVYLHGMVFLLGIAYALKQESHVRVDIFYQKARPRTKAMIDLLGTFLFLFPVALFIAWMSIDFVVFSWKLGEGSAEPGGLRGVYLLKALIPLMAISLIVQGVAEVVRNLRLIFLEPGDVA